MKPYIIIKLIIDGQELIISKTSVYRLISYDGIEAADVLLTTADNAIMDGGYIKAARIGMRDIRIKFAIHDKPQTETLRSWLIQFFKPKVKGTLYISRGGVTRRIYFCLATRPEYEQPNIVEDRLSISIVLKCPEPYFLDEFDSNPRYLTFAPVLNFPLTFLPAAGLTTGIQITSDVITINNTGDVDVGIICDISADKGSVTNPKISIDGGDFVRVITVLDQGDTLTINTRPGEKDIKINGESKFIYDITSIFFSVPVGEHTIQISADAGVTNANSSFTYALKYLGV